MNDMVERGLGHEKSQVVLEAECSMYLWFLHKQMAQHSSRLNCSRNPTFPKYLISHQTPPSASQPGLRTQQTWLKMQPLTKIRMHNTCFPVFYTTTLRFWKLPFKEFSTYTQTGFQALWIEASYWKSWTWLMRSQTETGGAQSLHHQQVPFTAEQK